MMPQRLLAVIVAASLVPVAAAAQSTIKIGYPMPLSGPASVYGVPIVKGAEMAVQEINASGGVLGRKLELLTRDSKASADEAVRLARELIIKNSVDFLSGTLTSAEAPAVSTIAKENKIVFVAPTSKTIQLVSPANLHPYIFRLASNTDIDGRTGASIIAGWKEVKRVATIAPDYAYGRDAVGAFVDFIKKARPDIEIVDQQWPKLGQSDFTPFITAQMAKKPDAVFCDVFGGDFVTFAKQAAPLGYFKAIDNRLADGGEVGTTDAAQALGKDYPYGIWSDAYDPVIWPENEPAAHKTYIEHLKAFTKEKYASGWAIMGYASILALAEGIKKAGSTNSAKVAKAMLGLSFDTPIGKLTFNPKTHETEMGEFWGQMVKDDRYPFAIMKNPKYLSQGPFTD
ncbi:ABC transporter substrate-binding protein [Enhydrobacter sp.]|jgi:branched-chain amino acid transport system substrate-binding protein|uniref:ABC transporter substrate-binding protein n=1 Tax=Enhydrobacter sp. TaxID=1894999 RepID=UPI002626BCFD|nr:ABC transporter substrate-binding protein [Enhydrobacter sp.]WIM10557.1 MAG: branched-chain amino acid ABC transporter, amino acid-binding protein [Enhydrobacter sp.]